LDSRVKIFQNPSRRVGLGRKRPPAKGMKSDVGIGLRVGGLLKKTGDAVEGLCLVSGGKLIGKEKTWSGAVGG